MTSRDFVYWLQGLFELGEPLTLNKKQTEAIRRHLAMVFIHEIDPSMGDDEHQGKLNSIHNPQEVISNIVSLIPGKTEMEVDQKPPTLPSRPNFLDHIQSTTVELPDHLILSETGWKEKYGNEPRPRC